MDLIHLRRPLHQVMRELRQYPWDSDERVSLEATHMTELIERVRRGEISMSSLHRWAEAVEMRDDVSPDDENVKDAIFTLANPDLHSPLTPDVLTDLMDRLATSG